MVFELNNKSGRITARLSIDNFPLDYDCIASVCLNPQCECNEVFLKFERPDESYKVGFNIETRTLIERENEAVIDEFANQVFALLDETDFRFLESTYLSHKKYATENADFSHLIIEFPKQEIETKSITIAYHEVLPFAKSFDVTIEGKRYLLEDHFCVKHQCQCTEIVVCLYPILNDLPDGLHEPVLVEAAFAIRIDYQSKKWESDGLSHAEPIDITAARSAVESQNPDFYSVVRLRHQRMKRLYSNYLRSIAIEKSEKVGRNDPCSCGSGKKYKKCCGSEATFSA